MDEIEQRAREVLAGLSEDEQWHVPWYGLRSQDRPLSPNCWPCSQRLIAQGLIRIGWHGRDTYVLTDLGCAVARLLSAEVAK